MKKKVFTQVELDKLVVAERRVVKRTIFGVGMNDVTFKIYTDGVTCWQYALWVGVLGRSFSAKVKHRQPTYKDVTCCDEWLSFANFFEWVNKEVDYKGKPIDMDLDKDLMLPENKVYCPEACSFVPTAINRLLNTRAASRGKTPLGVFFESTTGRYRANVSEFGRLRLIGVYSNEKDAFLAYKTAKEAQIKAVALQYKGVLKPAVFEELMQWGVAPY